MAIIALWLHFANKGAGAFFLQERPGKNAKIFKVIKFKTMTDELKNKLMSAKDLDEVKSILDSAGDGLRPGRADRGRG